MIYILDEAKNAECAREMLVSGNYIVPYFNGQLRTDKPPLHYFFMVLSYKIFGVSAFSARFFSAVFGALTILISFLFSRKYLSEKTGWLTAIILLASLHYNFQMRMSVPDPYLIFLMSASFMTFHLFLTDKNKYWLWLMYISFGLGLLTKGPIALGLPGLIMLVFLLLTKRLTWDLIRSFCIPIGILIMLAIALPWYWLNYIETNGVWTEGFFLKHNFKRFSDPMEGHGGFFLLPLIMVIAGLLPLGFFSIQALFLAYKNRGNQVLLFILTIVLGIIIFFSFSQTKLPNYTIPAYPFLAMAIGYLFSGLGTNNISSAGIKWTYLLYTLVALSIPAIVYFSIISDHDVKSASGVWIYFLTLPVGVVAGWIYLYKKKIIHFVFSVAFSFILTNVLFFSKAYPEVYSINPVASSIEKIKHKEKIVYYKMMNSAYVFNMQRIIPVIQTQDSLKNYLIKNPDAAVISRKEYDAEIVSSGDLKMIFEQKDIFEKPVTVIYELR